MSQCFQGKSFNGEVWKSKINEMLNVRYHTKLEANLSLQKIKCAAKYENFIALYAAILNRKWYMIKIQSNV